ncbi:MAG: helix-turn-helix transcriptional regulator [Candidatus Sumerlaeota bacterium]
MKKDIGALIIKSRSDQGLTQDQFGRKYNVSGPAIFKFEKGYVKPSLDLWLRIANDIEIPEEEAVLIWVRAKLPKKYQDFVPVESAVAESGKDYKSRKKQSPEQARKEILKNTRAPKGLRELLKDDDIWSLYQPTAEEIETLSNVFGPLGHGSKSSYREALRLVREFGEK